MRIPVFYTPKMVAESGSISPSAAKPAQVVASWERQFPIEVVEPSPVTVDDYARAHDRSASSGRTTEGPKGERP